MGKLILEEVNLIDFEDGFELRPELEEEKEKLEKEVSKELDTRVKDVEDLNGKEHTSTELPESLKLREAEEVEDNSTGVITSLINNIYATIEAYKSALLTISNPAYADVLNDIITDCYMHLGQLEGLAKSNMSEDELKAYEDGKLSIDDTEDIADEPEIEVEDSDIEVDDDIPLEVVEKLFRK